MASEVRLSLFVKGVAASSRTHPQALPALILSPLSPATLLPLCSSSPQGILLSISENLWCPV